MISIRAKDFFWSYIASFLNMGINVLILPFVLAFLDDASLGIWYVFASINTLVMLLDFGFTPTIARNIAYAWSGAGMLAATGVQADEIEDEPKAKVFYNVVATCKAIYLLLSIIAILLLFVAGSGYVLAVSPDDMKAGFLAAWLVYAAGVLCNLYFSYASACLRGVGAIAENAKAQTYAKIVQLAFTAILLAGGAGIMGTSVAYLASCLVMRVSMTWYFNRFDGVRELLEGAKRKFELAPIVAMAKTIWHNAWRDGLVSFSMFCSLQANTLICSYVLGLSSTGSYGLVIQIATAVTSVASVSYSTIQPKLQELALRGDKEASLGLFAGSVSMFFAIDVVASVAFLLVGPALISLFGKTLDMSATMMAVILIYMCLYKANTLFISCISNYNEVPYALAYAVTGVASVVASAAMAQFTSAWLWSLIIPPLVVLCCYNLWKWPTVALEKLGASYRAFAAACLAGLKQKIAAGRR